MIQQLQLLVIVQVPILNQHIQGRCVCLRLSRRLCLCLCLFVTVTIFIQPIITLAHSVSDVEKAKRLSTSTSTSTFSKLSREEVRTAATTTDPIPLPLPLGDINVLIITDDHSWLGGHSRPPYDDDDNTNDKSNSNSDSDGDSDKSRTSVGYDADYGHVVSLYERLLTYCIQHKKDLYIVMNGDWIDGTGLAYNAHIQHLIPLIQKMPFDVVNCGNHELYDNQVIQQAMIEPGNFVEWWGDRYVTSNVRKNMTTIASLSPSPSIRHNIRQRHLLNDAISTTTADRYHSYTNVPGTSTDANTDTNTVTNTTERSLWLWDNSQSNDQHELYPPVGKHYKILNGITSNVLVFGFLFNMDDADTLITVQHVQNVIQEPWFYNVLTQQRRNYDDNNINNNNNNNDDDTYDTILILAHMGARDPLIQLLVNSIRTILDDDYDIPIQVVAGHTHVRDYVQIDNTTFILEAGKFMETIGFVTFPSYNTVLQTKQKQQQLQAQLQQNQQNDTAITSHTTAVATTTTTTTESPTTTTPTSSPSLSVTNGPTIEVSITSTTKNDTGTNTTSIGQNNTDHPHRSKPQQRRRQQQQPNHVVDARSIVDDHQQPQSSQDSTNVDTMISDLFQYAFIDAKRAVFQAIVDTTTGTNSSNDIHASNNDFTTVKGRDISNYIKRTRLELGLLNTIGCMPDTTYYIDRSLFTKDSLWRLFVQELVPYIFYSQHVVILEQGEWRYNLYQYDVTVDDVYGISPYNAPFVQLFNISSETIIRLNQTLNNKDLNATLANSSTTATTIPPTSNNISGSGEGGGDDGNNNRSLTTTNPVLNRTLPYPAPYLHELPLFILASVVPIDPKRAYTLVISKWEERRIVEALKVIDPDWIPVPATPFEFHNGDGTNETVTTTNVWLNFVKEKYPGPCSNSIFSGFGSSSNTHHGSNSNHNVHNAGTGIETVQDKVRIAMSVIALAVVLIVTILYIQQRSKVYANVSAAQNHAVMSALREYNERDDNYNNRYDDDDDDEEEEDDDDDDENHERGDDHHGNFVNRNYNVSQSGNHDGNYNDKNRTFREEEYSNSTNQQQTATPPMKDLLDDEDDDDML